MTEVPEHRKAWSIYAKELPGYGDRDKVPSVSQLIAWKYGGRSAALVPPQTSRKEGHMRKLGICLTLAALLGIGVATAHALTCTTRCYGNICNTYCY